MKFGLYVPNFGAWGDAAALMNLAERAESSGWDGVYLWDHIAPPTVIGMKNGDFVDPWVALAAMATRTERVRLGTLVTPLPRRRVTNLARQTVSVDRLSQGRLTLGVGIGGGPDEFDNLGEESAAKIRARQLDEGLDLLTQLWSGTEIQFDGEFNRIRRAQFLPQATQQPRVPIWVGGVYPAKAPMRRMARWDGMFPVMTAREPAARLTQLKESIDFVRAEREKHARSGTFDIAYTGVSRDGSTADTLRLAEQVAALGVTWWLEAIQPQLYGFDSNDPAARTPIL
ncbi:MAG: LLM class flavin-dependent oxidoreductase [Chloroflexi bacterium]|nr:LLM class flavin-dependent oxidoreductase [Chloroflexota bacterium]